MAKTSNLDINVTAETAQASEALKNISSQIDKIVGKQNSLTSKAASVSAWGMAFEYAEKYIGAVVKVSRELVSAYAEQEKAETRLQSTLRATGNAIGLSTTELYAMADGLARVTTFQDQTIIGMQQIFVASGRISREALPQVTELALDMAEALGVDAVSAAKDLTRYLSDPIRAMDQLRTKNLHLSESEKQKIIDLQNANQLYEAQQVILDKIESAYGGIAREIAGTDTGKLQQIQNTWTSLKENLGQYIVNGLGPVFNWIFENLSALDKWFRERREDKDIMTTLASGGLTEVGQKFTPAAIQRVADENEKNISKLEETLRAHYAGLNNVHPNSSIAARWASDPWAFDSDPMMKAAYAERQYRKEVSDQLLKAKQNSENYKPLEAATIDFEALGLTNTLGSSTEATPPTIRERVAKLASGTSTMQLAELRENIRLMEELKAEISAEGDGAVLISEENQELLKALGEGIDIAQAKIAAMLAEPGINKFLQDNVALSKTAQIMAIDAKVAQAEQWQAAAEEGTAEHQQILDIIEALKVQRELLDGTAEAAQEAADAKARQSAAAEAAAAKEKQALQSMYSSWMDLWQSMYSFADQAYSNQISALERALQKQEEAWNKHYSKLKEQHEQDSKALDAKYRWGMISAEEYTSSMDALAKERADAEQEAAEREEASQEKLDELKRKQFEAGKLNSIGQALVSGAVAAVRAFADYGWPMGAVVAALTAGAVGMQVATIASQQYTPMATGGVVTSPTRTLLGEAGPELVLPLRRDMMENAGLVGGSGDGTINYHITVGSVYHQGDLYREVYEGITAAQRTGALPAWKVRSA